MTQFLIKRFVKDYENTEDTEVRSAYGRLASLVGILCNVLLCIGKMIAGVISGSLSITADAINNLSDASSNIISLLGFKLASKPADEDHPYGHGRYEYLAGLVVSALIMVIGVELFKSSINKILHPSVVVFSWLSVAVLAVSIMVKLWMMMFNLYAGKAIHSQTLTATASDSRNDVITTGAVLLAALISHFAHLELDGYMGLAVAVFICCSGIGLIKDTINPLLGSAPEEEYVLDIQKKIMSYPGVLGTHDLMIHDYGPGRQFASVHVEMAAEADVLESHDMIDNIERDFLKDMGLHMVIHYDPIVTGDAAVGDFRSWLAIEVKTIDESLTIHDLRMVPGPTHTNVIFDCVIPPSLSLSEKDVKEKITEIIKKEHPDFCPVITVETSYVSIPH